MKRHLFLLFLIGTLAADSCGICTGYDPSPCPCAPRPACSPCAQPYDCSWDPCDFCGDWLVGITALYWKPMQCTFDYATTTGGTATAELRPTRAHTVKADYDWGLRARVAFARNCTIFGVSYLYYHASDASEATRAESESEMLIPQIAPPLANTLFTSAKAREKFRYQNAEARGAFYLHRRPACSFYTFGNVRWVDLELRQLIDARDEATGVFANFSQKATFQGAGFGVGGGGNLHIYGCLQGFAEFNLLGIIGTREVPTHRVTSTNTNPLLNTTVDYGSNTSIIPALDYRLGFVLNWDFSCISLTGELGYEMNTYWNTLEYSVFFGNRDRVCENLGFGGPFLGLSAIF